MYQGSILVTFQTLLASVADDLLGTSLHTFPDGVFDGSAYPMVSKRVAKGGPKSIPHRSQEYPTSDTKSTLNRSQHRYKRRENRKSIKSDLSNIFCVDKLGAMPLALPLAGAFCFPSPDVFVCCSPSPKRVAPKRSNFLVRTCWSLIRN